MNRSKQKEGTKKNDDEKNYGRVLNMKKTWKALPFDRLQVIRTVNKVCTRLLRHEEDEVAGDHDVQVVGEENDGGLFAALDRIGEESDEYWDAITEQKIKEF